MILYAIIATITVILLTLSAFILLRSSVNNKTGKWYGWFMLSITGGYYVSLLKLMHQSYPNRYLWLFIYIVESLGFRLTPYFYFLANISASPRFDKNRYKKIAIYSLSPIILLYIIDIVRMKEILDSQGFSWLSFFWMTTILASCYVISSFCICFDNYLIDKNPVSKRKKMLILLLNGLVFPMTLIFYRVIPMRIWTWYLLQQVCFLYFALFMVLVIRNKILGYKVNVEISSSLRAANSGTSILNHTIKNEIAKIKLCIKDLSTKHNLDADDNIQIINASTEQIMRMMGRIQEKTQDITLELQSREISKIIDAALLQSKPLLDSKGIIVKNNSNIKAVVLCDEIHLREVICNLINNSMEAMKDEGGILNIDVNQSKKELVIEIKDNGAGIKKEDLPRLFEPFFTTKNCQSNYGLGLTYCYNVIKEHKGNIEIISDEGKGASVLLKLPLSKKSKHNS